MKTFRYFKVTDPKSSYFGKTGEFLDDRGGRVSLYLQTEDRFGRPTQTRWSFSADQIEEQKGQN